MVGRSFRPNDRHGQATVPALREHGLEITPVCTSITFFECGDRSFELIAHAISPLTSTRQPRQTSTRPTERPRPSIVICIPASSFISPYDTSTPLTAGRSSCQQELGVSDDSTKDGGNRRHSDCCTGQSVCACRRRCDEGRKGIQSVQSLPCNRRRQEYDWP
jgi:hypothetical protein